VLDTEIAWILGLGITFERGTVSAKRLADIARRCDAVLCATGSSTLCNQKDSAPNVFDLSVSKPLTMAVRAVANGRAGAEMVCQYLNGRPTRAVKPFHCTLGILSGVEKDAYISASAHASPGQSAAIDPGDEATQQSAVAEARRCLQCGCAKASSCLLRDACREYEAKPSGDRSRQRRAFAKRIGSHRFVYEPGKCISCGICVRITAQQGVQTGMAFIGRGFNMQVDAPLTKDVFDGVTHAAQQCVDACPTGALYFMKELP
jgi:ferredoxin